MFLTDYDEEKAIQMYKDEAYEDGVEYGLKQGRLEMLYNMVRDGVITKEIAINQSPDKSKLKEMLLTLSK